MALYLFEEIMDTFAAFYIIENITGSFTLLCLVVENMAVLQHSMSFLKLVSFAAISTYGRPRLFNSLFIVVRAYFELQTKIMLIFDSCF